VDTAIDNRVPRQGKNSGTHGEAIKVPIHRHEHIKWPTLSNYANCMGGRYYDRTLKRVALAEIAGHKGRSNDRRTSYWDCK